MAQAVGRVFTLQALSANPIPINKNKRVKWIKKTEHSNNRTLNF
jgi:hypothetical protein